MRFRYFIANILMIALVAAGLNMVQQGSQFFQAGENYIKDAISSAMPPSLSYANTNFPANEASDAITKVTPAVVSVYGEEKAGQGDLPPQTLDLPVFDLSLTIPRSAPAAKVTSGSGFFIDSDGYILTNKHVVNSGNASYTVTLADGTKKDAEVVYRDADEDLAILKISGRDYPALELGDSSKLEVGQTVISLGNAFGQFSNTASTGRVAALNRSIIADDEGRPRQLDNVIQTSVQLYPGDSGGPTFDMDGNVIGINVATALDRSNVSFSIPINFAKDIIESVTRSSS